MTQEPSGTYPVHPARRLLDSRTTLLGIVKHLIVVERWWFATVVGGEPELHEDVSDPDAEWLILDSDNAEQIVAQYRGVCAHSNAIARRTKPRAHHAVACFVYPVGRAEVTPDLHHTTGHHFAGSSLVSPTDAQFEFATSGCAVWDERHRVAKDDGASGVGSSAFRYAPRMQSMRMNSGPMVGLTWTDDIVARSASPGENALRYLSLLSSAGLVPVLITPKSSTTILARLDGLVVPGGPDVAPARYGQEPGPHTEISIEDLDALELELVTAARARNLPILGICRGQQVLNVALGGSLHQHLDHPRWGVDPAAPIHEVQILEGTYLRQILRVDVAAVNSGHHQAVDRLAPSLHCAAVSSDGCVEALEAPDLLLLAVQWHPEEMADAQSSRRLVQGFARWING